MVRRERGLWIFDICYRYPDGRKTRVRRVAQTQTRRGAEGEERVWRESLANPQPAPAPESPRMSDFAARWLATNPGATGIRSTTADAYEGHVRVYIMPRLGNLRLDEIGPAALDAFAAGLADAKLSTATRASAIGTLGRMLKSAVRWGDLGAVPVLPRVKLVRPEIDFLTFEEKERLLSAARDHAEYTALLCALDTGARVGEEVALRWDDCDLTARHIRIERAVTGPTKSGKSRAVPMTVRLTAALRAHRHLRGPFVLSDDAGRPLYREGLARMLTVVLRRAGLRRLNWHCLRHTFASHLIMKGVPLRTVQELLGHANITQTARYAHLSCHAVADAIRVLDDVPRGTGMAPTGTVNEKQ